MNATSVSCYHDSSADRFWLAEAIYQLRARLNKSTETSALLTAIGQVMPAYYKFTTVQSIESEALVLLC